MNYLLVISGLEENKMENHENLNLNSQTDKKVKPLGKL